MNFVLTAEQRDLQASVRAFLSDRSPSSALRAACATEAGYDRRVWAGLAEELGVLAVAIPEAYGGAGYTFVELAVVLEELGSALVPSPFLGSIVLAANALLATGDEEAIEELLPGIAAGTTIASLATVEAAGDWDPGAVTVEALQAGERYVLHGEKAWVLDGHVADLLLVTARASGEVRLFAVAGDAPGLQRTKLPALDATCSLARLRFDATPARLIAGADARGAVEHALQAGTVAMALEQVGAARRCLDMSVAYARDRRAYGRAIGSFQAIKHACADNFLAIESAWSAAYYAAWAAARAPDEVPAAASLAKAASSEAFTRAAEDNVQIHGGIGTTAEHDAQLYLKRAKSSAILLGDVAWQRERLARRIGL